MVDRGHEEEGARDLRRAAGRNPRPAAGGGVQAVGQGPGSLEGDPPKYKEWARFVERWKEARALADREGFLHWEVAFPGVWRRWQESRPQGGFDAVIGNPPWDRIKLQEVEWFATRDDRDSPGAHGGGAAEGH